MSRALAWEAQAPERLHAVGRAAIIVGGFTVDQKSLSPGRQLDVWGIAGGWLEWRLARAWMPDGTLTRDWAFWGREQVHSFEPLPAIATMTLGLAPELRLTSRELLDAHVLRWLTMWAYPQLPQTFGRDMSELLRIGERRRGEGLV